METQIQLECGLCGGNDFYKEAGYFYCRECQTQSQELREHEFEDVHVVTTSRKKVQDPGKKTKQETLLSWECYNYILFGLVNELLELGAHKSLKKTVKILWFKYLKKLKVVSEDINHVPQLQAVNSRKDAEILYGVSARRKRRRKSSSSANSSSSGSNTKLELSKRKQALIKKEFDMTSENVNESKPLLKGHLSEYKNADSSDSRKANMPVRNNLYATRELRKIMNKTHLISHRKDKLNTYMCHKLTFRDLSYSYRQSAMIITHRIQLSDMLRYINEGHLSYNEYLHFFPETLGQKKLNISTYTKYAEKLTHSGLRETAWKILLFLKLESYVPTQNIVELSERYCMELNLPDEIHQCVVSLIAKTLPYHSNVSCIPNYEGRTVCYIIFILKLLYGIDNKTEMELFKFANILNERNKNERKMFNFMDWITFIQYRKLVINDTNFPSHSKEDRDFTNVNLFINFMKEYNSKYDKSSDLNCNTLEDLLTKLSNCQNNSTAITEFPHSLTPFRTYLQILQNNKRLNIYNNSILEMNFKNMSIDYLLNADHYLTLPNIEIKHGGANDNLEFINIKLSTHDKNLCYKIPVSFTDQSEFEQIDARKSPKYNLLTKKRIEEYLYKHRCSFIGNKNKYIRKSEKIVEQNFYDEYKIHYQPYERFWLRNHDVFHVRNSDFKKIFSELPMCFRIILNECSRLTEQSCQDLYMEYCIVEQYLCYQFDKSNPILDKGLAKFVKENAKLY